MDTIPKKEDYDGSTPARVNIPAISTLAGADKALNRITKRQLWIRERRITLRGVLRSSTEDAERLAAFDEGTDLKSEKTSVEKQAKSLQAKKAEIASKRVDEIDESIFDDLD